MALVLIPFSGFVVHEAPKVAALAGEVKSAVMSAIDGSGASKVAGYVNSGLENALVAAVQGILDLVGLGDLPGKIKGGLETAGKKALELLKDLIHAALSPLLKLLGPDSLAGKEATPPVIEDDGTLYWVERKDGQYHIMSKASPSKDNGVAGEKLTKDAKELIGLSRNEKPTKAEAKQIRALRGKVEKEIDEAKNAIHEGAAAKGYSGVRMTPNGLGPDFAGTDYLYKDLAPGQKNIVTIKLQGSRYLDFKEANRLAGFPRSKPPNGYTWHHLADYDPGTGEATMQLVDENAHIATYTHKGSVYQWEQAHPGIKYDTPASVTACKGNGGEQ